MIHWFAKLFGYRIVYISEYGTHDSRYDSIDYTMGRPIHKDMGVAPPWAKRKFIKT